MEKGTRDKLKVTWRGRQAGRCRRVGTLAAHGAQCEVHTMYMYPCHVLSVHTLRVQASSPSALYVDVHVYVTRQVCN